MSNFEVWFLAVGLAMDCFAVSVASGILLKRIEWKPMLTMAFFFGLFQAMMPLVGWLAAFSFNHLINSFDHWIAFGILAYLGINMIRQSQNDDAEHSNYDPRQLKVIFTLAIATSIDALSIGISFACLGYQNIANICSPITIIGFVSFLFALIGLFIGIFCQGAAKKLKAEMVGGVILLIIGTKILIEHLLEHG